MFKILGADGKEYGPVSAAQIVQWIREGRANHETMVQRQGEFDWKPLAQLPEFADALGIKPAAAPPVAGVPAAAAVSPAPAARPAAPEPAFDARVIAVQKVNGPAIGLMVTGGLYAAWNLFGLIVRLVRSGPPEPPPGFPPEFVKGFELMAGPVGAVWTVIGIIVGVLILFGGIKMQRLQNRGLAIAAAIIAIVPCFSLCCVVGIPIGIWALVVLAKPEVRTQFE